MMAKGVRFNAIQSGVGKYLSTEIFEFTMRCRNCPNLIAMRTDPQNAEYKCTQGCIRIVGLVITSSFKRILQLKAK